MDYPRAILQALQKVPIVLSSPHSSTNYEPDLLEQMRVTRSELRLLEDGPIDELLSSALKIGAQMVAARFPRAFVDLNRAPDEMHSLYVSDWQDDHNNPATPRARAGLGLVPTHISNRAIYRRPISVREVSWRRERAYEPYHRALVEALEDTRAIFGYAILIDCHSMPEAAATSGGETIDITLGDRYGQSCDHWLVDLVENEFRRMGYAVERNSPYAGGYITRHYGKSEKGYQAIQIEIRRSLFMHEHSHQPNVNFSRVQAHLEQLVGAVSAAACVLV